MTANPIIEMIHFRLTIVVGSNAKTGRREASTTLQTTTPNIAAENPHHSSCTKTSCPSSEGGRRPLVAPEPRRPRVWLE